MRALGHPVPSDARSTDLGLMRPPARQSEPLLDRLFEMESLVAILVVALLGSALLFFQAGEPTPSAAGPAGVATVPERSPSSSVPTTTAHLVTDGR